MLVKLVFLCIGFLHLGNALTQSQYNAVKVQVRTYLIDERDNDEVPGDLAAAWIRAIFHDAGTFMESQPQSGANGCLLVRCGNPNECQRTSDENKGMEVELSKQDALYTQLMPPMSRTDFLYLCGNVAVEHSQEGQIPNFAIDFKYGRSNCTLAKPLFPGALPSQNTSFPGEILSFFTRLGLVDPSAQGITLMGAHTMGRCELNNSGFEGLWVGTPNRFDNEYMQTLLQQEWTRAANDAGNMQWGNVVDGELMMLNTDVSMNWLVQDVECAINANSSACVKNASGQASIEPYSRQPIVFLQKFALAFSTIARATNETLYSLEADASPANVSSVFRWVQRCGECNATCKGGNRTCPFVCVDIAKGDANATSCAGAAPAPNVFPCNTHADCSLNIANEKPGEKPDEKKPADKGTKDPATIPCFLSLTKDETNCNSCLIKDPACTCNPKTDATCKCYYDYIQKVNCTYKASPSPAATSPAPSSALHLAAVLFICLLSARF